MDQKELFNLKLHIIERAEALGITLGTRTTCVLDLENALKQFNMRLADWLAADDINFAHDWSGIQQNMVRTSGRIENGFIPRFATEPSKADRMVFIAATITTIVNAMLPKNADRVEIAYRMETSDSVKLYYSEWQREKHAIIPGEEYFLVREQSGALLYAVRVTGDSELTAASELMDLMAKKF